MTFAGTYPDKWYGWYCPDVKKKDMRGLFKGDAFPNQTVINAWGYKANDVDEIKDLLPEGFYNMIKHPELWGPIRINETKYIPKNCWPGEHIRLRNEATERYGGEPYLDDKGHIQNYKAGIPFPDSNKNVELAWNFVKARNYGQKQWSQFITAIIAKNGHTRYGSVENSHFWFNGLLYGDNKPLYTPNVNNYDFFHTVGYKAPYDLRGVVSVTYRYDDPDRQDDMWIYLPTLRKVRRLSTTQRWDKLPGGLDNTYDSTTGFQGKPTNYEWKYLGRKVLLCGHNSKHQFQQLKRKPGGIPDQQYQRVNTIILQYTPKIYSPISKGVMYLDPESYCSYYSEFYDKSGRLSLFDANIWSVDNDSVIHPGSMLITDAQRIHSSNTYIYNNRNNLDAKHINPEFFTLKNLKLYFGGR